MIEGDVLIDHIVKLESIRGQMIAMHDKVQNMDLVSKTPNFLPLIFPRVCEKSHLLTRINHLTFDEL
jgi:hypothetical protein